MRQFITGRFVVPCAGLLLLCCLLVFPKVCWAQAQWVHFGTNGTLVYFADDLTNHLIDYSYAGYEGGGVALPTNQTVRANVSPVSGDNTANIQNAINTVGALATNLNGIRGVVLLGPGNYEMDGTLKLNVGGVILRGSGNDTNTGTVLNFFGTPTTHLTIGGSSGSKQSGSTTYTITNVYVPLGATNFNLNTTSGLSVGMDVVVRRPWTQTWIDDIGMTSFWSPSGHQNDAERKIMAINGTQVTVDIPLPTPIEQKWVTGTVFPYTDSGRVQQCGVENLCMVSMEGGGTGTSNAFGATGIQFGNCKNCWVHDIAFSGYGPAIDTGTSAAKWCTAQDCTYANGINNGSARPPAFEMSSEMCLFQRLVGLSGFEHLCQTSDEATGPNVYLNCSSSGSDFDGGPHRFWAVSLLTDNESGTVGNVHIVIISGGDNGWGAGYSVFYNCHVNNYTIQEPGVDHTYNWWIGGSGRNTNRSTNAGIFDTAGTTVAPNSLYLEQLKERLGGAAVENIGYTLFSVAASPSSRSVGVGSNTTYTVTLGDPTSMKNTVALSATGLPTGASANFNTNSVTGAGSATLTLSTSNSITTGIYTFNIVGTSAGLSHTSVVSLVVGNPSFTLTSGPASQSVIAGDNTNFTVNVTTNSNFTGSVNFSLSGLPADANGAFVPPSLSGTGASTLNVTTASGTPPGTYPLIITGTGNSLTNTAPVTLIVNSSVVDTPGAFIWNATNGVSTNTNWSFALNWSPSGPPGPLGDAKFFDVGAVANTGSINNVVDANFFVNSLQYGNTNGNHTTLIGSGQTLTVGALTVGTETDNGNLQSVYATITGAGGKLVVNNANSNLVVRQAVATAGGNAALRATLDMQGLDMFAATIAKMEIGSLGVNARPSGTVYLARTNFITASGSVPAIQVGGQGGGSGNAGNGSFLYLGQSNAIFANGISVATVKQGGCSMRFNPALLGSSPSALFRGVDGVSAVPSWFIADSESQGGTVNTTGTNDFTDGTVDALVNTLTVARSSTGSGIGNPVGVLTFEAGAINVGTLEVGFQGSSGTNFPTATVNVNGTGTLLVGTNLELAHMIGGGGPSALGTLNINGGIVGATNIFGGGGISTINLNSGIIDLQAGNPQPGQIANISALNIGAPGVANAALLTNAASISASNNIVVASNGVIAGNMIITAPELIVNGSISPGGSGVGAITNSGTLTLGAGGTFILAVQDALGGSGVGWDFLKSGGKIDVEATNSDPFTIKLQSVAGNQLGEAANFNFNTNYDWVIATADGGLTNFSADKFAVDDALFQNDLGGGYFYLRTNGPFLVLSFTNNHPPIAGTVSLYRTGSTMAISVATLAAHWSDPDGDPVELSLVDGDSGHGTNNVGTDGAFIYYTNALDVADTITYTVVDVRTNPPAIYRLDDTVQSAIGSIVILPPPSFGTLAVAGSSVVISGSGGIGGANYYVLTSTNAALPLNLWQTIATNSFNFDGSFQFTNDLNPNSQQQYYRLELP